MEVTINGKTITVSTIYARQLTTLIAEVNEMLSKESVADALNKVKAGYYCGIYDMYDASRLAALVAR